MQRQSPSIRAISDAFLTSFLQPLPMLFIKVLHSRMLLDSYRLLAAPERSEWARAPLGGFPVSSPGSSGIAGGIPTSDFNGSCSSTTVFQPSDRRYQFDQQAEADGDRIARGDIQPSPGPAATTGSSVRACRGPSTDVMRRSSSPAGTPTLWLPPPPSLPGQESYSLTHQQSRFASPHPADWERRIRHCLALLQRRPLLCPEDLLRRTEITPRYSTIGTRLNSPDVHCGRGDDLVFHSKFDSRRGGWRG